MGHVPSLDICEGLILVVVDIFTGEDVGPLVGLGDTGDEVGKRVGRNDFGALESCDVGLGVIGRTRWSHSWAWRDWCR